MGTSFSSNITSEISPEKLKIIKYVSIGLGCVILLAIILGVLAEKGVFNGNTAPTYRPTDRPTDASNTDPNDVSNTGQTDGPIDSPTDGPIDSPTDGPTVPSTPVGSLALFSPTNDGKVWTKVFDSMTLPNKCFLNFNEMEQFSPEKLKKILKYQYDNNMLPIDNPFKNIKDVPVIGCSGDETRMILTLDLSKYNGVNPFKQGDALYIYGIDGETNANSKPGEERYVFATMKEYPRFITSANQIMIASGNPCDYQGTCSLDNSLMLFSSGTYTNGGIVRYVGNAMVDMGFIPDKPAIMYYLYMAYKNYQFNWPFEPMNASQAYSEYSRHYDGYMQWLVNFPQTCTQVNYIDNSNSGFVSGPVTVSGGSGTGLQIYLISLSLYEICLPVVTNDGVGYKTDDVLNITQGSINTTVNISSVDGNCLPQKVSISPPIYLSYQTSQQQLRNLLDYAMSLDSSINTVVFMSNNTYTVPDNYNNPNITLLFGKTSPDSTFTGTNYISSSTSFGSICSCNSRQDQGSSSNFFPNKINQCANQIIYTSNTVTTPYDFINNADAAIGPDCNVPSC
jgi:hypothetical protein